MFHANVPRNFFPNIRSFAKLFRFEFFSPEKLCFSPNNAVNFVTPRGILSLRSACSPRIALK